MKMKTKPIKEEKTPKKELPLRLLDDAMAATCRPFELVAVDRGRSFRLNPTIHVRYSIIKPSPVGQLN